MMRQCDVYLIPGFFGFASLGGITYFHHVRQLLITLCEAHGIEPIIHYVPTHPTASIRMRAARLYQCIEQTTQDPKRPIYLIGHSTGGLDARLFMTPDVSLPEIPDVNLSADRVRAVVTIATPHLGTPLASFFDSLLGQKLLYLISMSTVYTMRFGRLPLAGLFQVMGIISRLDDHLGLKDSILDQFYEHLFADFHGTHRDEITVYLEAIRTEQALLGQLTPGGIDLLNAAASDRPGVRYGCAITRARKPETAVFREIGLDPYRHASHLIYRTLYWLTSRVPKYPAYTHEQEHALVRAYGSVPERGESDGIVPTRSQLHGEILHAAWADHLDVCGHYSDAQQELPHVDWLSSGTGFNGVKFMHMWEDIVAFIARD